MNYNDEFDDLIKNFKLDDMSQSQSKSPTKPRQTVPSRGESDPHQASSALPHRQSPSSQQQRPPAQQQRPPAQDARRPMAQDSRRAVSPVTTKEPVRRAQENKPVTKGKSSGGSQKENFRVNIDDSKFYTPGGIPPRPPRGGRPEVDNDDDDDSQDGFLHGLGRWTKAFLVLFVALGISAFLAYFALMSANDLFGLNKEDRDMSFTMPEGLGVSQVASLLKEKGVISQPLTFQLYATLKKKAEKFIPGTYDLNSNMSYDQIISRFSTVRVQLVEKQITFYEGMTMREIAELLEKEKICDADKIFEFLEQSELPWTFDYLKNIPDTDKRYRRMEGYLFPDTYTFNEGESVDTVVQKFLVNFNNKFDEDMRAEIKAKGMTIDEVVTMASIIQKEVSNDTDMRNVSSVFHNRLKSTDLKRLQSDVTIFYIEDNIKPYLGGSKGEKIENDPNQAIYDAYNTYVQTGLPVGPICNPGMDAIRAVLEPLETGFYYFVADKNGKTYFAETQAEHDKNVADVLTLGEAHGVGTGIGPLEEDAKNKNEATSSSSTTSGG